MSKDYQPILDKLEETRLAYQRKNKNRFWRMLLRTWIVLSIVLIGIAISQKGFQPADLAGLLIAFLVAFPVSGIAFLVAKGKERIRYERAFDQTVLSSILEESSINLKLMADDNLNREHLKKGHLAPPLNEKSMEGGLNHKRLYATICIGQDLGGHGIYVELEQDVIKPDRMLKFYSSDWIETEYAERDARQNNPKLIKETKLPYGRMYEMKLASSELSFRAYCDTPGEGIGHITEGLILSLSQLFTKYKGKIDVVISDGLISMVHYRSDAPEFLMLDAGLSEEISHKTIIPKFKAQVGQLENMIRDLNLIEQ